MWRDVCLSLVVFLTAPMEDGCRCGKAAVCGVLKDSRVSGAGAEIQKPLATVVIGVNIISMLLTRFVLSLSAWFERDKVAASQRMEV